MQASDIQGKTVVLTGDVTEVMPAAAKSTGTLPKYVFVFEPGGPTNYPSSAKFTWQPQTGQLGFEAGATAELLDEVLATGVVDGVEKLSIGEWCKKLTHLPDSISRLTELRSARVETKQFVGWEGLYGLTSLRSLFVGEKVAGELPAGISGLQQLEELTIKGKGITSLPADIGSLERLKSLTIVNTKLTELPEGICGLAALESLVLSFAKKVKSLPEGMERLGSLRHLKTVSVPLATLPEGLAQHPELRTLEIQSGKVKKLPPVDWPKLESLDLFGPLSKWPTSFAAPMLNKAVLGDKFKELPALASDVLEDLVVNAPLSKVDPALAAVAKLRMQCTEAAYQALTDDERAAFGDRLRPTWS